MKTIEEMKLAIIGKTTREVESYFRENYKVIENKYWNYISQFVCLSDEFIEEFADNLDWDFIFKNKPPAFMITFNSLLSFRQIGRKILVPRNYAENVKLKNEFDNTP